MSIGTCICGGIPIQACPLLIANRPAPLTLYFNGLCEHGEESKKLEWDYDLQRWESEELSIVAIEGDPARPYKIIIEPPGDGLPGSVIIQYIWVDTEDSLATFENLSVWQAHRHTPFRCKFLDLAATNVHHYPRPCLGPIATKCESFTPCALSFELPEGIDIGSRFNTTITEFLEDCDSGDDWPVVFAERKFGLTIENAAGKSLSELTNICNTWYPAMSIPLPCIEHLTFSLSACKYVTEEVYTPRLEGDDPCPNYQIGLTVFGTVIDTDTNFKVRLRLILWLIGPDGVIALGASSTYEGETSYDSVAVTVEPIYPFNIPPFSTGFPASIDVSLIYCDNNTIPAACIVRNPPPPPYEPCSEGTAKTKLVRIPYGENYSLWKQEVVTDGCTGKCSNGSGRCRVVPSFTPPKKIISNAEATALGYDDLEGVEVDATCECKTEGRCEDFTSLWRMRKKFCPGVPNTWRYWEEPVGGDCVEKTCSDETPCNPKIGPLNLNPLTVYTEEQELYDELIEVGDYPGECYCDTATTVEEPECGVCTCGSAPSSKFFDIDSSPFCMYWNGHWQGTKTGTTEDGCCLWEGANNDNLLQTFKYYYCQIDGDTQRWTLELYDNGELIAIYILDEEYAPGDVCANDKVLSLDTNNGPCGPLSIQVISF